MASYKYLVLEREGGGGGRDFLKEINTNDFILL